MKKKLLTILLSVFMVITSLTINVFAEYSSAIVTITFVPTCGSIKISGHTDPFTISPQTYSLTNIDGEYSITLEENKILLEDESDMAYIEPIPETGYVFSCWELNGAELTSNTTASNDVTLNAVFTNAPVVEDILPDNFPQDPSFLYWINNNSETIFICDYDNDEFAFGLDRNCYITENFLHTPITINSSNNYEASFITQDSLAYKAEFIMNGGSEFNSIVISGFTGEYSSRNGTYNLAVDFNDVVTSSLPLETGTHWTSGDNEFYFYEDFDQLYLKFTNSSTYACTFLLYKDNLSLYKVSDNVYKIKDLIFTDQQTDKIMSLIFNVNGTTLKSIDASFEGEYSTLNGTYTAPVTIADVLNTVPGGFPTTRDSGWFNENDMKVYKDNTIDVIHFDQSVGLNKPLQKDGNNYKYSIGNNSYTFVMTSGVLTSINIEGVTGFGVEFNGEFFPHKYNNSPISKPVGYSGNLVFLTNAHYNGTPSTVTVYIKLQEQSIEELDPKNYILEQGSTKVTLKGSYVKTLPAGTHTIIIGVTGYDDAAQDFTITATPTPTPVPTPRHVVLDTGVE